MKRIVYIVTSLGNSGGIERVLVNKANYLVSIGGYEVTIITEDKNVCYYHVDSRVKIYSLDIKKSYSDYRLIRVCRLIIFFINYGLALSRLLRGITPDIVISVNARDFFILPFINKKSKKIYEFHWIVTRMLSDNESIRDRIYRKITDFVGNKYDKIVLLTKQDEIHNCHEWRNTIVIPNPCTFTNPPPSRLLNKRAIAVGNLFHIKGFMRLIDIWSIVNLRHPDWFLSIYGEGYLREELQLRIDQLSLTNVVKLEGVSKNIMYEYLQSSCALVSSYEESFSMVILEAMSCGLPVVAFDCPWGPSEIITNGHDGYLIPNNDLRAYADKVSLLIESIELRIEMGKNAVNSSESFTEDKVMSMWLKLFEGL